MTFIIMKKQINERKILIILNEMSNKKSWHILITSNSSTGVKGFHISKPLILFLVIFVSVFVITTGVITYFFVNSEIDRHQLRELQDHNIRLKTEMTRINSLLDTMQFELENVQEKDKEVRELEGLRSIDDDIRQMGVGGIQYFDSTFFSVDKELFDTHNSVLNKIDAFTRQIDFEKSSFSEISKYLTVKNTIYSHTPSIKPTYGRISQGYGYRVHPIYDVKHFHHGVDIANREGSVIYATADGKVVDRGYHKDYGYYLLIDHGYGYKTFYGHFRKRFVITGQEVTKYQIIGEMGSTGTSTGSHLHYEVRFYGKSTNPINYFNKKKSTICVDKRYLS